MGPAPPAQFVHRQNRDGTYDSVCKGCCHTVRTSHWEADLDKAEREHKCDPWELARLIEARTAAAPRFIPPS